MQQLAFNKISPNVKNSRNSKKLTLVSQDIGETNVAINLSGQIEIRGELEFTDTQSSSLSNQNNESWNLDIDQKQRFDLEGQVGDRLTISADQNSESDFDFENSKKVILQIRQPEVVLAFKYETKGDPWAPFHLRTRRPTNIPLPSGRPNGMVLW